MSALYQRVRRCEALAIEKASAVHVLSLPDEISNDQAAIDAGVTRQGVIISPRDLLVIVRRFAISGN